MQKQSSKYWPSLVLGCLFSVGSFCGQAQSLEKDLAYFVQKDSLVSAAKTNFAEKSGRKRFNPVLLLMNGSLKAYQRVISPQLSATCLYELSCSRFSQAAIKEYGPLKGVALSADRLARCNRLSATTINPFRISKAGKVIDFPKMYQLTP